MRACGRVGARAQTNSVRACDREGRDLRIDRLQVGGELSGELAGETKGDPTGVVFGVPSRDPGGVENSGPLTPPLSTSET